PCAPQLACRLPEAAGSQVIMTPPDRGDRGRPGPPPGPAPGRLAGKGKKGKGVGSLFTPGKDSRPLFFSFSLSPRTGAVCWKASPPPRAWTGACGSSSARAKTTSPGRRSSIGLSPSGVRTGVPAAKQPIPQYLSPFLRKCVPPILKMGKGSGVYSPRKRLPTPFLLFSLKWQRGRESFPG